MDLKPFGLRYGINEGINVTEDSGDGYQESVEVIVRGIGLFQDGVKVDFELLNSDGTNSELCLHEEDVYQVTHLSTLRVPRKPLRGRISSKYSLRRSRKKVFLTFCGREEVEFGERKMYD